jgi:hypothetical protein
VRTLEPDTDRAAKRWKAEADGCCGYVVDTAQSVAMS